MLILGPLNSENHTLCGETRAVLFDIIKQPIFIAHISLKLPLTHAWLFMFIAVSVT